MAGECRIRSEANDEGAVTLRIVGMVDEEALGELEESLNAAEHISQRIYIDLSEVTLLDRAAARWLSVRNMKTITCINCPGYISRWISS